MRPASRSAGTDQLRERQIKSTAMKWAIEAAELYDKEEALRVLRKAEVFLLAFIYQGEEEASPSPPERVVRVVQD